MGRRKKNGSSVLVGLVDDFYEHQAGGDPGKLKYSALEKYARSRGVQASWHDFRRDGEVLRRIRELRERREPEASPQIVPAYKSLDIEGMLRNARTAEELKRKLFELDCYWKKAYDDAVGFMEENRKLSAQKSRCEAELRRLELEKEEQAALTVSMETRIRKLEKENAYLRRTLRECLYPAVADELLRESGLSSGKSGVVRPDAFPRLIEGDTPQPFDGVQVPASKEPNRQERLLSVMKEQASRHGK